MDLPLSAPPFRDARPREPDWSTLSWATSNGLSQDLENHLKQEPDVGLLSSLIQTTRENMNANAPDPNQSMRQFSDMYMAMWNGQQTVYSPATGSSNTHSK